MLNLSPNSTSHSRTVRMRIVEFPPRSVVPTKRASPTVKSTQVKCSAILVQKIEALLRNRTEFQPTYHCP